MKLSIATIQTWIDKQKAKRHDAIKKEIEQLQINRNFAVVTNQGYRVTKLERKIRQLQKKLRG